MKLYESYHKERKFMKSPPRLNDFTYSKLFKLLDKYTFKNGSALDIGCGVGTVSFFVAKRGMKVKGIDISKNAIRVAKRNLKILKLDKNIDFENIKFPNSRLKGTFDLIICSEVLEHLKDDKKSARLIYNLLKKKGVAVVTVPSINAPLYKLGLLRRFDKEVGHFRRYNVFQIKTLFKNAGFVVVEKGKWEGILRNFVFTNKFGGFFIRFLKGLLGRLFTLIDDMTIKLFGESDIYLVVKK